MLHRSFHLLPILLLVSCDMVDSTPGLIHDSTTQNPPSLIGSKIESQVQPIAKVERFVQHNAPNKFDTAQFSQLIERAKSQENRDQLPQAIETWNKIQRLIEQHFGEFSWQATNVRLAKWNVQWRLELNGRHHDQLREIEQLTETAHSLSQERRMLEARIAWSKASTLARQVWPPISHPLAIYLSLEADAYRALGQFTMARETYQEVLAIREQIVGRTHPDYVTTLYEMGDLYRLSGQLQDAVQILDEAVNLSRQLWGTDHVDYANPLSGLGLAYHAMKDYKNSLRILQQVAEIRRRHLGENHPSLAETQYNLGSIHFALGQWDLAIAAFDKARNVFDEQLGPRHHQTLMVMDSLAAVHTKTQNYPYAERLLHELYHVRLKLFGSEHPDTIRTQFRFAVVLGNQGRYDEAEPLLLRVAEIQDQTSPTVTEDLKKTLETYAVLLQKTGRPIQAKELLARTNSMTIDR